LHSVDSGPHGAIVVVVVVVVAATVVVVVVVVVAGGATVVVVVVVGGATQPRTGWAISPGGQVATPGPHDPAGRQRLLPLE